MKAGTAENSRPGRLSSELLWYSTKNNIRAFIVSVRIFFGKKRVLNE